MGIAIAAARAELERFLAAAAAADRVVIGEMALLAGGTVHENWRLDVTITGGPHAGAQALVVRVNRPLAVQGTLSLGDEFAVMRVAHAAGVTVPEPLWASSADGPLGQEFFVMRWVPGTSTGSRIVRDASLGGDHARLAERLGEELARLQTVTPGGGRLPFLTVPPDGAAARIITRVEGYLDSLAHPHPAIEWGLRWLRLHAPPPGGALVLTHGDFRTGNYLVDQQGLTGILDWELGSFGDPLEDLGWFFMKVWRYGAIDKVAGGLADRAAFLRGYERRSGRTVDLEQLLYWEVLANVKWAAVSIQQGERHVSGIDKSLELCLTGRMTAEMEYEALRLLAQARA